MVIYTFPGLAADYRVFYHIRVPEGYTIQHIKWERIDKQDTLTTYAIKLAKQIDISKPFVLMGLSMGGMLATEIAKQFPPHKLILISSISSSDQLPSWYRWGYKWFGKFLIQPRMVQWGIAIKRLISKESKEDKQLIKKYAAEIDMRFVHQCIHLILNWRSDEIQVPTIRIHGSADWILPYYNRKADHIIKHAGHLMILDRPNELNAVIKAVLMN